VSLEAHEPIEFQAADDLDASSMTAFSFTDTAVG
jgi:hypothetical protein